LKDAVIALVRVGYVAKAVVYVLVGVLAFRVAAGFAGGRITDPAGAWYEVLRRPFGETLLLVLALGLLSYAAWQILGAVLGWRRHARETVLSRALTILRASVYGLIGWQGLRLATGLRSRHTGPEPLVRAALDWPFGEWLVIAAGIGAAWYGVVEIRDAIKGRLEPDLEASTLRSNAGEWALHVSRVGIIARALILVLLGVGVIRAGLAHRASAAGGFDTSLVVLNSLPQGSLLLGATAAGLLAYGFYQFLHARYATL
jgi:hypothetical protein